MHLPGVATLGEDGGAWAEVSLEAQSRYPSLTHVLKLGSGVPWMISQTGRLDAKVFSLQILVGLS